MFQREAVEGRILAGIDGRIGTAGAEVVQSVLTNVERPKHGIVSLAIGIVTQLFGATTALVQSGTALNRIWDVERKAPREGNALWALVRDRLLSLLMILGVGFLLLVSLVVSAALSAAGEWFGGRMALDPRAWLASNTIVSFAIVSLRIAVSFKFLPDAKIRWRDVAFGSLLTALLFTLGKYLIGLYLGRASIGSASGAAGSVVALMVWVYCAARILFVGAEITFVLPGGGGGIPSPSSTPSRARSAARSDARPPAKTTAGSRADASDRHFARGPRLPNVPAAVRSAAMPLDSLVAPLAAFLAPTSPLPPPPVQFHGEGVVHTTVYAGLRSMRDDFAPADEPWTLGIALDIREPGRQAGLEFGYFYSQDEGDTDVGANTIDVDNTVHELWAGGRWTFDPWGGSLQPYLGLGGSLLYAKFEASGIGGEDSNSGWAVGVYGHGGLDWKFAEDWSVGLDLRALVTTQAKLQREVPLDSLQAALTLSWSW